MTETIKNINTNKKYTILYYKTLSFKQHNEKTYKRRHRYYRMAELQLLCNKMIQTDRSHTYVNVTWI